MKTKEYTYPSSSGICPIKAWQWYPDDEKNIKGVIQFHHGMAEHSGRYIDTMKALTDCGYAVFMNDMLGHGQSNEDRALLGYFGDKNGYKSIITDAHLLTNIAKKEYGSLPFIIIGHSMGSFVMRCYINEYGTNDIDGAVFIGTSGENPLTKISIVLTNMISAIKGKKHHSQFCANLSSKGYNDRNDNTTPFDWLSHNKQSVDDYIKDPLCGFNFTLQGYQDLAYLVDECNCSKWYANVPRDLPVLLLCGSDDPVGNYSEGVKEVYDRLVATDHTKAKIIVYPSLRHEVLNEPQSDEVISDIDEFIKDNVKIKTTIKL